MHLMRRHLNCNKFNAIFESGIQAEHCCFFHIQDVLTVLLRSAAGCYVAQPGTKREQLLWRRRPRPTQPIRSAVLHAFNKLNICNMHTTSNSINNKQNIQTKEVTISAARSLIIIPRRHFLLPLLLPHSASTPSSTSRSS